MAEIEQYEWYYDLLSINKANSIALSRPRFDYFDYLVKFELCSVLRMPNPVLLTILMNGGAIVFKS